MEVTLIILGFVRNLIETMGIAALILVLWLWNRIEFLTGEENDICSCRCEKNASEAKTDEPDLTSVGKR